MKSSHFTLFVYQLLLSPPPVIVQAEWVAGRSHRVCGRILFRQWGRFGGHHGKHPPTEGLLAGDRRSRNQKCPQSSRSHCSCGVSIISNREERKPGAALGMRKITVYDNASPFFQSNVPSLVFYLPGLLALSLPLPLALSSAEVLCPGNRTGNDIVGRGPHRASRFPCPSVSSQMFCVRLLA